LRQPTQRLFTLTGFGGIGKTRVAMALAERSLPYFAEGVWWCEQEQARDGEELLRRLAEQLRLPLQAERPVRDQVHQYVRDRSLLLVLDNLEQVEGAAQVVRDLLQAGPSLKVLVTSRRALELRGEMVLELSALPVNESVALFVERVQSLRPDFALNPENQADIRALCRALEGMPLAVELAAARCIGMTPRQIRQRLNERFRLLQSKSPDLSPRQRALRSAIDWSYCLLGAEEKRIFAQLSVFVGGFTLEDAEAVCEGWDVLESVLELRKHSFFRSETDAETQQDRFLMLETLREYAAEELLEADEESRGVGERHAAYFLHLAREQIDKSRTAEETQAVRLLERQGGNLEAALAWARQAAGRVPLYAELARLVGHRLYRRGFLREATEIVTGGLAAILPLREEYPGLAAELLRERAGLHLDHKEYAEALPLAEAALELAAGLGDGLAQARAENLLGQAAMNLGEYERARAHFQRGLAQAKGVGASVVMGNIYNNLGLLERRDRTGDDAELAQRRDTAARHLQESLWLRRANQDRRGLAETHNSLGMLAFDAADWAQARSHYAEALPLLQELQNTQEVALMLANLGEVAGKQGEPERAVPLLVTAEDLLLEAQSPYAPPVTQMLQEAAQAAGIPPDGVAALRAACKTQSLQERIAHAMQNQPHRF
jgi:predicted ATPase